MTATIHKFPCPRPVAAAGTATDEHTQEGGATSGVASPFFFRPVPKPAARQPSRFPLPCGRKSGWKKPMHGDAVRRKRTTTEQSE